MFELITGNVNRPLRERAPGSKLISLALHIVAVGVLVVMPLMTVSAVVPHAPAIVAFVAAAAPPPPPPPPPPMARRAAEVKPAAPPTPSTSALAAPLEAPASIKPEPPASARADVGGVEGGVEGGVPGGVIGGIVGGLVSNAAPPPPPPPPPPPAPAKPVRIGGQLTAPAVLRRVPPEYPDLAANAHVTGMVILEAVVDKTGHVESVTVLRSRHPLLDRSSVDALKQWQYAPLVLDGAAMPFVLTVTFTFNAS